ncbi:hypothetical protein ES703_73248 [subsurface metagenome]
MVERREWARDELVGNAMSRSAHKEGGALPPFLGDGNQLLSSERHRFVSMCAAGLREKERYPFIAFLVNSYKVDSNQGAFLMFFQEVDALFASGN